MVSTLRRQSEVLAVKEPEAPRRGGGKMGGLRRGYSSATPPTSAKPKAQQALPHHPHMATREQGGGAGRGAARRGGRGALMKQSKVEDGLRQHRGKGGAPKEKSSIPIPTIIVKAPSTSSSGRSSQGSSMEAEASHDVEDQTAEDLTPDGTNASLPSPLTPSPPQPPTSTSLPSSTVAPSVSPQQHLENVAYTSTFSTGFGGGGARRERERFRDMRRKSASFFLSSEEDIQGEAGGGEGAGEGGGALATRIQPLQGSQMEVPTPRLRPSKSIDEGMFSGDNYFNYSSSMPPAFGLPEYSSPILSQDGQPKSAPSMYGSQPATTFIHPLTGKVLDPSSPLGLALAARERALKDDRRTRREDRHFGRQLSTVGTFPTPVQTPTPSLFATPTQSAYTSPVSLHLTSPTATTSPASLSRPQSPRILRLGGGGGERVDREKEGGPREGLRVRFSEDRNSQYSTQYYQQNTRERDKETYDSRPPPMQPPPPPSQPAPRRPSFLQMDSTSNTSYIPQYTVPTAPEQAHEPMGEARAGAGGGLGLMVLPPPAPSIDVDEEFVFADPLPPPLQFANGKNERVKGFPQQYQHPRQHSAAPPPPPPLPSPKASSAPQPSPQGGDSAASSLTSYDSEVANLTQSALSPSYPSQQIFPTSSTTNITSSAATAMPTISLHRPQPMSHSHPYYSSSNDQLVGGHTPGHDRGTSAVTNTMTYATTTMTATAAATTTTTSPASSDNNSMTVGGPRISLSTGGKAANHTHHPTITTKGGDWQDAVVDSGIEELDSHSSSDHHLEMLGLTGLRVERGGIGDEGRGGDGDRGGETQDPCTAYPGGQTFEVQSAKMANPVFPKMTHYKEGGGRGPPVALRRQNSTNPAPLQLHRQNNPEDARLDGAVTDERKHRQNRSKMEDGYILADCFERPMETHSVGWGEVGEHEQVQRDGMAFDSRRLHSPLSGVKASIINELSSKLQQMSSMKSMDDWSHTPKSPTMHRSVCRHHL